VLAARRMDRLHRLQTEIAASGGRALAVQLDVAEEPSVVAAFDAAQLAFGQIDGVVANAGVTIQGRALDVDMVKFNQLFAVNVGGVFQTAREGARRMRAAGLAERGRIVLISSITAQMCTSGTAPYSASKAAVAHMGKVLAREWVRSGPNVNVLSPGYLASELAAEWFASEGGEKHMATWPRRRMLDENALDAMLIYLLSDESRNVTGSNFVVDDGQSL
jgi:NAD(P)-dependent dehydrogenase (short-subunit alcohol dehydrogenase family)